MRIVIVSGLPCSGKSKLAERLRAELRWPLLAKDVYKELLFDALGHSDRDWSRRLSAAAYELMFAQAEELLRCGQACLLEGNFRYDALRERFERLQRLDARFIQAQCRADPDILIARFRERALAGSRHPGHADTESLGEMEREIRAAAQAPLPLGGSVTVCDTGGDWRQAIEAAVAEIKSQLYRN